MALRHSVKFRVAVTAAFLLILALTHAIWLSWLGELLVRSDEPFHADMIVVPGGGTDGRRIVAAGELIRRGFAPQALVSGAPGFYDLHESDLAIPFAVKRGYPAAWFIPWIHEALSTDEEAQSIAPELQRRHVRSALLVTSDYHSRRALRTFRARTPHIEMRVIAVPSQYFTPGGWWRTREGRKIFFLEWAKTFASFVGF